MAKQNGVRLQVKLTGESADIFQAEQKKYEESNPVVIRRILKDFKRMKELCGQNKQ